MNISSKYANIEKINLIKAKLKKSVDNPKLNIIPIITPSNKKINVIQDGVLICGTKQRVSKIFFKDLLKKDKSINHLLYAGVSNGFGAIATAYAANKLNLKCTVFMSKKTDEQQLSQLLQSRQVITLQALGANIYLCSTFKEARSLEYDMGIIDKSEKIWKPKDGYYIVPMGMNDDDQIMINLLSKQMKKSSKDTILELTKNPRIWVVSGSGGIAMAINKAFPNAELFILLTGGWKYKQRVKEHFKNNKNVVIINNEPILNNKQSRNNIKNYYNSVEDYDDLIWPYVKKYGKDDDFIWNVSSESFV